MWLNEWEIEDLQRRWQPDPLLGPATATLSNLVRWTNSNSDGWPYWKKPAKAAEKLMVLLHEVSKPSWEKPTVDKAQVQRCMTPIKAFRTRQGADFEIVTPA